MIKLKEIIEESPLDVHQTIGDFSRGSSFTSKADRALITNPKSVQKVKDFFKNTDVDFDFYFVNNKYARHHMEVGRVKEEFIYNELKVLPEQLKDGRINKDHITVFFTNNIGDERVSLTAWIIAHRFGHVIARDWAWADNLMPWVNSKLDNILISYGIPKVYQTYENYQAARKYRIAKRHLCETIGTFKSARDKNLREDFEFLFELFAQYLKTGDIKLNPLPDVLVVGSEAFGWKKYAKLIDKEDAVYEWEDLIKTYSYYANDVLSGCVGNIYVM